MAGLPEGVADRTCPYGSICVTCTKFFDERVCREWSPMWPGSTVKKYHAWLRKQARLRALTGGV